MLVCLVYQVPLRSLLMLPEGQKGCLSVGEGSCQHTAMKPSWPGVCSGGSPACGRWSVFPRWGWGGSCCFLQPPNPGLSEMGQRGSLGQINHCSGVPFAVSSSWSSGLVIGSWWPICSVASGQSSHCELIFQEFKGHLCFFHLSCLPVQQPFCPNVSDFTNPCIIKCPFPVQAPSLPGKLQFILWDQPNCPWSVKCDPQSHQAGNLPPWGQDETQKPNWATDLLSPSGQIQSVHYTIDQWPPKWTDQGAHHINRRTTPVGKAQVLIR